MDSISQQGTSAYEHSRQGISRGMAKMAAAAETLSQEIDVEALVDMKMGEAQVKASVASMRTIDDSLGYLLDALG